MEKYYLGIEYGSTRVKAVLIDEHAKSYCSADFAWENHLEGEHWSYSLGEIEKATQSVYQDLAKAFEEKSGQKLKSIAAIGISAMMHGYLAFDENMELLAPFRTWRNTNTDEASKELSSLFSFTIPHRWSIAHFYQAILNGEEHVEKVRHLCTLASYIHFRLSSKHAIGIGDASGMFPIEDESKSYHPDYLLQFNQLEKVKKRAIQIEDYLPTIYFAGDEAGRLTKEGARFLDPSGVLEAGTLLCPPEGDAGTGMVATNSLRPNTGNVSVGTSIFAMFVLEHALAKAYPEIDMVTTPDGSPVAMVHCNNGTPEIDAWVSLFRECMAYSGNDVSMADAYEFLYEKALEADPTCAGIVTSNLLAGEPVLGVHEVFPFYKRDVSSKLGLDKFMLSQMYSLFASLRIGMEILESEDLSFEKLVAHGGVFKTKGHMQSVLASVLRLPVSVYQSASEGGAWGMAILASFASCKEEGKASDLLAFVDGIFQEQMEAVEKEPEEKFVEGFGQYLERYKENLKSIYKA